MALRLLRVKKFLLTFLGVFFDALKDATTFSRKMCPFGQPRLFAVFFNNFYCTTTTQTAEIRLSLEEICVTQSSIIRFVPLLEKHTAHRALNKCCSVLTAINCSFVIGKHHQSGKIIAARAENAEQAEK